MGLFVLFSGKYLLHRCIANRLRVFLALENGFNITEIGDYINSLIARCLCYSDIPTIPTQNLSAVVLELYRVKTINIDR